MSRKVIVNGESICYLPPVDASEINYTRGGVTTTVEDALDKAIYDDISYQTIKGLNIDCHDGTTESRGGSRITVGNDISEGTVGNSKGDILLYSNNDKWIRLYPPNNLSSDRQVQLPSYAGTLARIEDIPSYTGNLRVSQTKSSGDQTTITFQGTLYYSGYLIVAGDGNGAPIFAIAPIHSATLLSSALENLTSKTVSVAYDDSTNILTVTTGKWCAVQILCTNTQFV